MMKRFIILASCVVALLFLGFYAIFSFGWYIDLHPEVTAIPVFRTSGKDILYQKTDGTWDVFEIRGVDLSTSIPGGSVLDFEPEVEDYARWLGR